MNKTIKQEKGFKKIVGLGDLNNPHVDLSQVSGDAIFFNAHRITDLKIQNSTIKNSIGKKTKVLSITTQNEKGQRVYITLFGNFKK